MYTAFQNEHDQEELTEKVTFKQGLEGEEEGMSHMGYGEIFMELMSIEEAFNSIDPSELVRTNCNHQVSVHF